MKFLTILLSIAITCFSLGAVAHTVASENTGELFQVGTIASLAAGVYDGNITYKELSKHGDLGLGTFNRLNGEMVAVDGKFYQFLVDGKTVLAKPSDRTPFAEVVFFKPQQQLNIHSLATLKILTSKLLKTLKNKNVPCVFRVNGVFSRMTLRSVPAQHKPYPDLAAAAKMQHIFYFNNVRGTLVGFYFPPYLSNIGVSGFHFHFISHDGKTGGHVLDVTMTHAKIFIQPLYKIKIELPHNDEYAKANIDNTAAANAIKKAEQNPESK